jgi:hemerythrin
MPLINWDSSYSVKVIRCDNDHKKLFALINGLHDAMLAGKGEKHLQHLVKELENYTKFHFSAEEQLLEKAKYPALVAHCAAHRDFEKTVNRFHQDLAAGKGANAISMLNFLKDWLAKHIKQVDQQYSAHLNANGVC